MDMETTMDLTMVGIKDMEELITMLHPDLSCLQPPCQSCLSCQDILVEVLLLLSHVDKLP